MPESAGHLQPKWQSPHHKPYGTLVGRVADHRYQARVDHRGSANTYAAFPVPRPDLRFPLAKIPRQLEQPPYIGWAGYVCLRQKRYAASLDESKPDACLQPAAGVQAPRP